MLTERKSNPVRRGTRRGLRAWPAAVVCVGVALALGACGGGDGDGAASSGGGDSLKIGWSQSTRGVNLWNQVAIPAFEKEVRAQGHEPLVQDAQNNEGQQEANFDNLLSLGVKSLVILPVAGPEAAPLVQRANAENVPVIDFNTLIPSDDVAAVVSRDNVEAAATIAKKALEDTGLKGNWMIINGDAANSVSRDVKTGFHQVIDQYVEDGTMKLVSEQYAEDFSPDAARAQVEDTLTKHGNDIQGILVAADETAVGALAALEAEGLAGKVWIGAQNGIEAACRAILEGKYNVSVFTNYDQGAKQAADLAIKLAKGEEITSEHTIKADKAEVPFFPVPIESVTKDTLVDYLSRYPGYVDAAKVFEGIPESEWPAGAEELLAEQSGS